MATSPNKGSDRSASAVRQRGRTRTTRTASDALGFQHGQGRLGLDLIALTVLLFLLVFLQPLFVDPELDPRWLRSLHVLNALFIFALGYHLAQRGTKTVRGMAVAA
jgi:hypothetical protein